MRKGLGFSLVSSFIVITLLFLPGCFVTKVSPAEAEKYFNRAEQRIASLVKEITPESRASVMRMIVYDGSSEELVQFSFPLALLKSLSEQGLDLGEEFGDLGPEVRSQLSQIDLSELEDLPPCLLIKVMDGKDRVLIWLE